jgi:hypothetical protein
MPKELKDLHVVVDCSIFDMKGVNLKNLPGDICVFLDDGSFLSATKSKLRMYNKLGTIVWEMPGHFHHQVNLSLDKQHILAMGSESLKEGEENFRYDQFLVIGLDGKIKHKENIKKYLTDPKLDLKSQTINDPAIFKEWGYNKEKTHCNSFYEVPKLSLAGSRPMEQGDLVINCLNLGVFIVSKDLKSLKLLRYLKASWRHQTHDVQITQNGHALVFNNIVMTDTALGRHRSFSAVQIIDLESEKIQYEFKANPEELFFSPVRGGAQELGEDLLVISPGTNGSYIYSRNQKKVVLALPWTHWGTNFRPLGRQQAKVYDLRSFLSHAL